ncbi:hypothetical protein ABE096_03000 [Robertmurraya massiliosenegalensis]|uniref:hypothetical protein n=1 Tax=Robertmurraya TaxID=2837507 RepID=UPI0039A4B248
MNKKIVASIVVGGICLGIVQLPSTFFASDDNSNDKLQLNRLEWRNHFSEGDKEAEKTLAPREDSFLQKLGISIEGKSIEEIENELLKRKASELGLDIEKKSNESIRFAVLAAESEKLGISTEGKDEKALIKELEEHQKDPEAPEEDIRRLGDRQTDPRISSAESSIEEIQYNVISAKAKELGIVTKGKDFDALLKELRSTLLIEKAKEEGISTDGKSEDTLLRDLQELVLNKEK